MLYRVKICNFTFGVPTRFLFHYNSEQFEIIRFRKGDDGRDLMCTNNAGQPMQPYFRILIRSRFNS